MWIALIAATALAQTPPKQPEPQQAEWLRWKVAGQQQVRLASGSRDPVLFAQRGDTWRVVFATGDIRVLRQVPVSDLARVTSREVYLQRKPNKSDEDLLLAAGVALDVGEAEAGWVPVTVADDRITVQGWLPSDAVDKRFKPAALAPVDAGTDMGRRFCLAERTPVLDSPKSKGRVLATAGAWGPDCPRPVARMGAEKDGYREITWFDADLKVRGWVPDSALEERPSERWDPCTAQGELREPHCDDPEPTAHVDGGTWLYDGPNGEPVGHVLRDSKHQAGSDGGGWRSIKTRSPWGMLTLWVPPE